MRPSLALSQHIGEVRAIIRRFPVGGVRVFGSVVRGEDQDGGDLDLLVDVLPHTSLMHLAGLRLAIQDVVGVNVDLVTSGALRPRARDEILSQAKPI